MSTPYPQQPVGQPATPYAPGQPAAPYAPGQPVYRGGAPGVFDCAAGICAGLCARASRACDSEGELGIDHLGCCRVDSHRPDGAGHVAGSAS